MGISPAQASGFRPDQPAHLREEAVSRPDEDGRNWRDFIRHLPDGALVHEPGGKVVCGNRAAAECLDLEDPRELEGQQVAGLLKPWAWETENGQRLAADELPPLKAEASLQAAELVLLRRRGPGGPDKWCRMRSNPIRREDGSAALILTIVQDVTEPRCVEGELRRNEARLNRLAESGGVGIFMWQFDGRVTEANQAFLAMLGLDYGDLEAGRLGLNAVTPEEWRARDEQAQSELARAGTCRPYEKEFLHKDGRRIAALVAGATVPGTSGGIGLVLDFSGWKMVEDAMVRNQERLRLALNAGGLGIWDQDFASGTISLTQRSREILALEPNARFDEGLFLSVVHPEDKLRLTGLLDEAKRPGSTGTFRWEFRICLPQGGVRWISSMGTLIFEPSRPGRIARRMVVALQDISDRKRAAEEIEVLNRELRHRVEDFQVLFDTVPVGLVLSREISCARIQANPALYRLFGYPEGTNLSKSAPPGEIPGYRCFSEGRDLPAEELPLQKAAATGEEVRGVELEVEREDGSRFHILEDAVPLLNSDGSPRGAVAVVADITQRKRNEEIRKRIQERRNQAQKLESMGRLAGGVAHNFNNMMAAVIGNAELLLGKEHDREKIQGLRDIREAGERAAALTGRLLAFGRRQMLAYRNLNLCDTANELLEFLRAAQGTSSVRIDVDCRCESLSIIVDRVQFEQCLMQLCLNSRNAMPHGGNIRIEVRKSVVGEGELESDGSEVPAGEYALVTVKDDGEGMDEEVLQRAMEPFFTTRPFGQALGMGLPMVHGFVRQSKGFLLINSRNGGGTAVEMYFPLPA